MTKPETCRDVLATLLDGATRVPSVAAALGLHDVTPARILAAIAADEAERARLRRIEVRQWEPALDYLGGGEYVSTAVEDCDGEYYLVADVAPLLAELATLRDQTRRRDAATEPPAEGEWVFGLCRGRRKMKTAVRRLRGEWLDESNLIRDVLAWWPLPPTEE